MNKKAYNPFICTPIQRAMVYCQNILPLAFDNSLSYYEFLCAMHCKLNEVIKAVNNQNLTMIEFQKLISQEVESFEKTINENFSQLKTDYNNFKTELLSDFETFQNEIATEWGAYRTGINNRVTEFETSVTNQLQEFSTLISTISATVEQYTQKVDDFGERVEAVEAEMETFTENAVGRTTPEGSTIEIEGTTYSAGRGAEYFNSYEGEGANKNYGSFSSVFGSDNTCVSPNGFVAGSTNICIGVEGVVFGRRNAANGHQTTVFGRGNIANGEETTVFGKGNVANGKQTTVFGWGNVANNDLETVLGSYNDDTNPNLIFTVGNGGSDNDRSNAFAVDNDGYMYNPDNTTGYKIAAPMTQTEYDAITNPDSRTIYIIVPGV